jgi:hypothetical protein
MQSLGHPAFTIASATRHLTALGHTGISLDFPAALVWMYFAETTTMQQGVYSFLGVYGCIFGWTYGCLWV